MDFYSLGVAALVALLVVLLVLFVLGKNYLPWLNKILAVGV